jgi:transposase-like protein
MADSRRSPHELRVVKSASVEALDARCGSNMVSARTHCPHCHHSQVIPLNGIFYSPNVDFFRCDSCRRMWHVEEGKDGPPSQTLLGQQTLQTAPEQPADGSRRKSKP